MKEIQVDKIVCKVRRENPLVHNITNEVVTNFTANGLLALGASPVMAYAKEEVADMAKIANALVLNIGTLDSEKVEAMIVAGKSANEYGVPVIFDPVGAGATPFRTESARKIVKEVNISVLRGNAAEVAHVIGRSWQIKGVDAGKGNEDKMEMASYAANLLETVVVITGKKDIATDGNEIYLIENGHSILTKVTGAGCLLSSVIGAFHAVEREAIKASAAALAFYGAAAETAALKMGDRGPGSFQVEFLDQLSVISGEQAEKLAKINYQQTEND